MAFIMDKYDDGYRLTHELKHDFNKRAIAIAIPVIIQNLISIGLGMVDTIMIGKLGEEQLAGVGAGNQVLWLFWGFIFGYYSGANAHSSQYYGAGDIHKVRQVMGLDVLVGIICGVVVCILSLFFSPYTTLLFSRDPVVVGYGVQYVRIVCFANFISFISYAITYNCRVVSRLKAVTIINMLALSFNMLANYTLIFGKFGFPRLEVQGAAIATVVARIIELAAVIIYLVVSKDHPLRCNIKELFSFHKDLAIAVTKTALPVVGGEVLLSGIASLVFAIYGLLGTAALAVVQVAEVVANMTQVTFFGLGNACAVLIGQALGQFDEKRAFEYGRISIKIALILCVFSAALILILIKPMAVIYGFAEETTSLLIKTMIAWSIVTFPQMMAYTIVCGILRAGGDTMFCFKMDILCNVFIQIPLALLAVVVFHAPLYIAVLFVNVSVCVKVVFTLSRTYSRRWINTYNV